jgi:hypothetical protein
MPIIQEVEKYFIKEQGRKPYDPVKNEHISVLNPGCGMSRLPYEFA